MRKKKNVLAVVPCDDDATYGRCDDLLVGAMTLMRETEAKLIANGDAGGTQIYGVRLLMRVIAYVRSVEQRTRQGDQTAVPEMLDGVQKVFMRGVGPPLAITGEQTKNLDLRTLTVACGVLLALFCHGVVSLASLVVMTVYIVTNATVIRNSVFVTYGPPCIFLAISYGFRMLHTLQ